MKSTHKKSALSVALILIIVTLHVLTAFSAPKHFDIPLDYLPTVDYHPTITLGDSVVIVNRQAYATPLLFGVSDDLFDTPLGIYANGVEARVVTNARDSVADRFGFVQIAIGGNGLDSGFSGYIEKKHLVSPGAEVPSLPTVTLKAQDEETVALLLDFAEDAPIVAAYPNGTQAQLLGYLADMCHVQIGDKTGFVETSRLELPPAVVQGLNGAMPNQFDTTTAQDKHASSIYVEYFTERTAQYGSHEAWPLWLNAEFSALCVQLDCGTGFLYGVNIVPGPEEITEQKALSIAVQAIYDSLGITQETLLQFKSSVNFYDSNYDRTGHYWYFAFWNAPSSDQPMYIEISISSPAGEVADLHYF